MGESGRRPLEQMTTVYFPRRGNAAQRQGGYIKRAGNNSDRCQWQGEGAVVGAALQYLQVC